MFVQAYISDDLLICVMSVVARNATYSVIQDHFDISWGWLWFWSL